MGNNIAVPSSLFLQNRILKDGDGVIITGQVTHNCNSFSVNLCQGLNIDFSQGDVIFQFRPSFRGAGNYGYIARNSRLATTWVAEESQGGMPLSRGQPFTLHIVKEQAKYEVSVNNRKFCSYWIQSSQNPQYLYIEGDVIINSIVATGGTASYSWSSALNFSTSPSGPKQKTPKAGPFSSYIKDGVKDGLDVVINGHIASGCNRFSINLCCGSTIDQGDVALHFKPRFPKGNVLRTHKQGGTWGAEETAGGLPFHKGKTHTIVLKAKNNGYKVKVDKQHFCDFTHRLSMATVQYLYIDGDFNVDSVEFKYREASKKENPTGQIPPAYPPGAAVPGLTAGPPPPSFPGYPPAGGFPPAGGVPPAGGFPPAGGVPPAGGFPPVGGVLPAGGFPPAGGVPPAGGFPPAGGVLPAGGFPPAGGVPPAGGFPPAGGVPPAGGFPPAGGVLPAGGAPPYPGTPAGPIYNPTMPVNTPIQGGFYPGKIVYITGQPHNQVIRFQVKLACGFMETSDLAFYFDARFRYNDDHNVVVRNHKVGHQFGEEERQTSYFPFIPGVNFEMMLMCEPHCIKVAVNNQHFLEFKHRIQALGRIDHLQITGEVSISQIRFQ